MMLFGNTKINGEQQESGAGGELKKGPWTAAEDAILSEYVRKHGEGNWNAVQRNTGLPRCGKSCRLRWANHLRPNLKKGAFSPQEERLILQLHSQLGNKWARMAAQLPGRTDNEIKNYWNTRVKRRNRQGLPLYPPEIQVQHQQSSHSHHSYHSQSQPSTPTTPTSSFSFPITPTGNHQHHHHFPPPCYSRSPTSSLPPLSPGLQSPRQPAYPTLTLFDTNNNNNAYATANNNYSAFNMPRTPPLLQNPPRFNRFHSGTSISSTFAFSANNNNNTTNNSINSSNNFQGSTSYSMPILPVSFTDPNTSTIFRSPDEKDSFLTSTAIGSVYNMKPELPSSQLLSPNGNAAEIAFENEKLSVSTSGSGLLEDLLEQIQEGNYGESSRRVNEWGDSSSMNLSSGLKQKEETGGKSICKKTYQSC